jgi:hypothetical protein
MNFFLKIALSVLLFLFHANTQAQKPNKPEIKKTKPATIAKKEKEYSKLSIKGGFNISVIYLARNIKDNNNEPGYSGGMTYRINDYIRVSGLYTKFKPINIEPTWLNVNANTIESNLEIMANFPNKQTLLYPFAGFSYNTYKGYFTGKQDYLNLIEYYPANSIVKNNWVGFNLGTGIEHNFGIIGLYFDYRMRVGKQERGFNIMDVCYTGGIKINLPKNKTKSIFRTRDRFNWF